MPDSTGLINDLDHLHRNYVFDLDYIAGLMASPKKTQAHMRGYKRKMYLICVIPILIGLVHFWLAFTNLHSWIGLGFGILGSVTVCHFVNRFMAVKKSIGEVEKIASYHELI